MSKLINSLKAIRGLDKLPSETLARVNKEIRKRAIKREQKEIIKISIHEKIVKQTNVH